ncbi:hypothetical protein AKO1_011116 [Acrasis kona]|uniref:Uncharacterized protein n=1 Tax=Acrasis kona TaxID=1008807 RepID=A0AAW2YXM8_9EUKA
MVLKTHVIKYIDASQVNKGVEQASQSLINAINIYCNIHSQLTNKDTNSSFAVFGEICKELLQFIHSKRLNSDLIVKLFEQFDDADVVDNYEVCELTSNKIWMQQDPEYDQKVFHDFLIKDMESESESSHLDYESPLTNSFFSSVENYQRTFIQTCSHDKHNYDMDLISSFGKAKECEIRMNGQSMLIKDPLVTLQESAYMSHEERPPYFKTSQQDKLEPTSLKSVRSLDRLEELNKTHNVDALMAYGGYAGGRCELLVYSPNKQNGVHDDQDELESKSVQEIEQFADYFGQPGAKWMNFDDVFGDGVPNPTSQQRKKLPGDYVITDDFKYYPGELLLSNKRMREQERRDKGPLQHLSSDQHVNIPIHDIQLLLHSIEH